MYDVLIRGITRYNWFVAVVYQPAGEFKSTTTLLIARAAKVFLRAPAKIAFNYRILMDAVLSENLWFIIGDCTIVSFVQFQLLTRME